MEKLEINVKLLNVKFDIPNFLVVKLELSTLIRFSMGILPVLSKFKKLHC